MFDFLICFQDLHFTELLILASYKHCPAQLNAQSHIGLHDEHYNTVTTDCLACFNSFPPFHVLVYTDIIRTK